MKIIEETSGRMVLRQSGLMGLVVALAFIAVGASITIFPHLLSHPKPPIWVGCIFAAIGFLVIFKISFFTTIFLDKALQRLTIEKKYLLGRKQEIYELEKIKGVELRESTRERYDQRGSRIQYAYTLLCIFNDGQTVPLHIGGFQSGLAREFASAKVKEFGEKVARFLSVPFQDRRAPTVGEILSTVKDTIKEEIHAAQRKQNY